MESYTSGMYLEPDDANLTAILAREFSGPVTMLNLLRFREQADYSDRPDLAPAAPISGREAYDRYIDHTIPFLAESGGALSFLGDGGALFIGPSDERWDLVMLVRQVSIESFFAFAENQAYMAGIGHRTAALEDSRLLPIVERSIGD